MSHATRDAALAQSALHGDTAAMDALARRWLPAMRGWALADLGDPVLADDAVQNALLRLMDKLSQYDAGRPFRPWLRTLVRSACADTRRGRSRHDRRSAPETDRPVSYDPGREIDLDRAARAALDALCALSPRQREVWILCHRQGLTPTEAAADLGVAPGTARALLHQGRRALRRALLRDNRSLADVVSP